MASTPICIYAVPPIVAPTTMPSQGVACANQVQPVERRARKSPSPCPNRTNVPVTKVKLTGILPALCIAAFIAPIANTIGSAAALDHGDCQQDCHAAQHPG